ncbi:hypothetical protein [uncultured Alistipes sp.]|uniref:hypothetical protein n=1 Tax=uncultured Alistipes sp. TaxID=538949 RepID=UPI00262C9D93|nr:hypothetical protein [uncultured Alistipes sp.]
MEQLANIAILALIDAASANAKLDALKASLGLSDEQLKVYTKDFHKNLALEIERLRPTIGNEATDTWLAKIPE